MGKENSAQVGSPPDTNSKTIALVISSLAMFLMSFMASSLNVALPAISREFRADAILLGWMVTAYTLAMAVFSVPFGRIADIVGIKKIFMYGIILFTITSTAAVFSISSIMLIVCRSIQGIGAAMFVSTALAILPATYPPKERGRPLGINVACAYIGASLGPFLGGMLTEHFGWRSIFYINIPGGLIVILLLGWKIKGEWCECKGEKFDYIGSIIYGVGLIALMYGFSLLPEILGGILVLLGIIGLLAFLKWESRTPSPVLNISILRNNKVFIFSILATLIGYAAVFAVSFLLSLYLQYIKGLTPEQAGLVMLAQPVMQAALSPYTGRLSDKIEPRIVASAGMALTCAALLSFIFLTGNTSLMQIIIILVALGVGIALFSSPNANAIMSAVVPKFYGVASAALNTTISIGQMLSMGITMMVIAIIVGRVVITSEHYLAFLTSAKVIFGVLTILCFAGIFTSLFRGKAQ